MRLVSGRRLYELGKFFETTDISILPLPSEIKKSFTTEPDCLYYCLPIVFPMYYFLDGIDVINRKTKKEFCEEIKADKFFDLSTEELISLFFNKKDYVSKTPIKFINDSPSKKQVLALLHKTLNNNGFKPSVFK